MPGKKDSSEKKVSKLQVDPKDLKSETIPNVVLTGGLEEIGLHRITPIEIPEFLLMHPALPRGIEIKANRMIRRVDADLLRNVFPNKSKNEFVKEAAEYCKRILFNSGGPLFLKKLTQGAFRFGTSYAILQTNQKETEVLQFEYQHEIFFGPAKYPGSITDPGWNRIPKDLRTDLMGKMKIDFKTKKVSSYTQLTKKYPGRKDSNYKASLDEYVNTRTNPDLKTKGAIQLEPVGEEIKSSQVIQLFFDSIGDEQIGISLLQFLHLTIKHLLNMERGAAQTQVNFGFNRWVAKTPFKDDVKMRKFAVSIAGIYKDAVVVLPEGITLENIIPGTTDFDKVHSIFLQLIAIRLGIPLPLLTQSSTETNKATLEEQRKDMYDDFIADELTIEQTVNDGFFKACQIKWPELSFKELIEIVPVFVFKVPPEDIDSETDRNLKFSLMIRNFATAIKNLAESSETTKKDMDPTIGTIAKKIDVLIDQSFLDVEAGLHQRQLTDKKDEPKDDK